YSTVIGGASSSGEQGQDIVVDGAGNAYFVARTASTACAPGVLVGNCMPLVDPLSEKSPGWETYIGKLSFDPSAPIFQRLQLSFSSFLGGNSYDDSFGIDIDDNCLTASDPVNAPGVFDADCKVYVAGTT